MKIYIALFYRGEICAIKQTFSTENVSKFQTYTAKGLQVQIQLSGIRRELGAIMILNLIAMIGATLILNLMAIESSSYQLP